VAQGRRPAQRISERALFLGSLLLGSVIGVPAWTFAKGQWCNSTAVRHQVRLTLVSATVSGVAVTPPAGATYDLTSSSTDTQLVSAHLYNYCEGCAETDQDVGRDLVRQP
jgi:hypothetical protein